MHKFAKIGFGVALLMLIWRTPLLAQTRGTHNVTGVILDPSNAAIPGAHITLTGKGQAAAETDSDNTGGFTFSGVAYGDYKIKASHEGFSDSVVSLSVRSANLLPVKIVLPVYAEAQVISVQAGDAATQVNTEIAENKSANTVDRAALDRVPVFDQDYVTTLTRFLDDSAIGTNGVALVVNGVEANGPGVTASAVQEVRINQNPYSVMFSRPGRARLEITTKTGTPKVHGTVNFLFRDAVFDATNAFAPVKPTDQRRYYEGSLTGPVGHGSKTTFLLSLQQDQEDQAAIVFAQGVQGVINETVPNPNRHFFGSGRIFHDLANGDQFWIGYSYERETIKNQGVGGTVLPEAGTNYKTQEHEINVSYRHLFSPHWLNQLRFLVGQNDTPVTSVSPAAGVVVSGAFTGGGAQADSRRTEVHFDGTDIVSFANGKHDLKFGIDVPDLSRRGADDFTNRAGTYTFGSLAAYVAGQPSTYFVQQGQGHLVFVERTVAGFIEDLIRLKPNFSLSVGARYYWQNYFHDDSNNFAPRFGFAYAPSANSKTVVRGGAGIFYDRSGPRPIADLLHFNGVNLLRYIVENPSYPVIPLELVGLPTSVVVLDPKARIPYTAQYSFGMERQITAKSSLSANYVGSRGMHLFRSIDANAPPPPDFIARPNPNIGQEREIQSEGYQKSNSLEVTFKGKPSKYFNGQVQYTFGRTDNNTGGITYFPANSYNANADWGRGDFDRRHKFDLLGSSQPTRFFTIGVALSLYSGKPVNIITGADNNRDGVVNDRPPGVGRNTLAGPNFINLDVNLAHDFTFARDKKHVLTVALNAFNVFNHPNDLTYVGVITSPFFDRGVIAQPPRRMQLDTEFKF